MRALVLALVLAACGDNLAAPESPPDANRDAAPDLEFVELYGLSVGARWTYASGLEKVITSCEQVELPDCAGGRRIERVWVRETRAGDGTLLKVHYLQIVPEVGVVRVREDASGTTTVWSPYEVRLVAGPYTTGAERAFSSRACTVTGEATGDEQQRETIGEIESIVVLGVTHAARTVTHLNPSTDAWKKSWYVRGLGEVREDDDNQGTEELVVGFQPGFGVCP